MLSNGKTYLDYFMMWYPKSVEGKIKFMHLDFCEFFFHYTCILFLGWPDILMVSMVSGSLKSNVLLLDFWYTIKSSWWYSKQRETYRIHLDIIIHRNSLTLSECFTGISFCWRLDSLQFWWHPLTCSFSHLITTMTKSPCGWCDGSSLD